MAGFKQRCILPYPGETLLIRNALSTDAAPLSAEVQAVHGRSLVLDIAGDLQRLLNAGSGIHREIDVSFDRASALYYFRSKIVRWRAAGSGVELVVATPAEVTRVQRRQEVRIPIHLWTRMTRTTPSEASRSETVQLVDLSAIGAKIECGSSLEQGEFVEIDVPTGKDGSGDTIRARVVTCTDIAAATHDDAQRFEARLQFDNGEHVRLAESTRDEIANYIFEQQRMALKVRRLVGTGDEDAARKAKKNRILANIVAWMRAPSRRWKQ